MLRIVYLGQYKWSVNYRNVSKVFTTEPTESRLEMFRTLIDMKLDTAPRAERLEESKEEAA